MTQQATPPSPATLHTVRVPSPCVSVCMMSVDTPALCMGCFRTIDEIAGWSRMLDGEKREIWTRIVQRISETGTEP